MKQLSECKEYYKDLFTECLAEDAFGKSTFEYVCLARFEMFCETLIFVYGEEFERINPRWSQEAINEFYSQQTA